MDTDPIGFRPPYLSFQTFWKFLEELSSKPLPPRVDRSIMTSKSGTDQANLTLALTSFGLTDTEGHVQPALTQLVTAPADERPQLFAELIRRYYEGPLRVSSENGSPLDLNKAFTDAYPSIASADTRRKAVTFFLHAARHSGIELSPHFPATRSGSGAPGAPKAKRVSSRRRNQGDPGRNGSTSQGAAQAGAGQTNTVTLKSAGTVTLTYDVNLFEASDEDQKFVIGLINKLRAYQKGLPATDDDEEDGAP